MHGKYEWRIGCTSRRVHETVPKTKSVQRHIHTHSCMHALTRTQCLFSIHRDAIQNFMRDNKTWIALIYLYELYQIEYLKMSLNFRWHIMYKSMYGCQLLAGNQHEKWKPNLSEHTLNLECLEYAVYIYTMTRTKTTISAVSLPIVCVDILWSSQSRQPRVCA